MPAWFSWCWLTKMAINSNPEVLHFTWKVTQGNQSLQCTQPKSWDVNPLTHILHKSFIMPSCKCSQDSVMHKRKLHRLGEKFFNLSASNITASWQVVSFPKWIEEAPFYLVTSWLFKMFLIVSGQLFNRCSDILYMPIWESWKRAN